MAQVARTGWLGVAVESNPGTPQTPADYIPYTVNTMIGKHTPLADVSAIGQREKEWTSVKGKQWGTGSVEVLVDPTLIGYWIKSVFGTENKTTVSGGVYSHAFTVNEAALPVPLTLTFDKNIYREWFPYSVVKDMEIDVTDGLATLKANIDSQFPTTTTSGTNSIPTTPPTLFTFKDLSVQFGASLATAQACDSD